VPSSPLAWPSGLHVSARRATPQDALEEEPALVRGALLALHGQLCFPDRASYLASYALSPTRTASRCASICAPSTTCLEPPVAAPAVEPERFEVVVTCSRLPAETRRLRVQSRRPTHDPRLFDV